VLPQYLLYLLFAYFNVQTLYVRGCIDTPMSLSVHSKKIQPMFGSKMDKPNHLHQQFGLSIFEPGVG